MVCVPVTSHIKGYPFEVALSGAKVTGVALADQVKSLDWRARRVEYKDRATDAELGQIKAKIKALLEYS